DEHSDVREAHVNPFLHYALYGESEARTCRSSISGIVTAQVPDAQSKPQPASFDLFLFDHEIAIMQPYFDQDFYVSQAAHINFGSIEPLKHYAAVGWHIGLDPSPTFSTSHYLQDFPDVRESSVNPFVHYLTSGKLEAREARLSDFGRVPPTIADGRKEWIDYKEVASRQYASKEPRGRRIECVNFTHSLAGSDIIQSVMERQLDPDAQGILVSVIIPCINEAIVTAECLLSLLNHEPTVRLDIILIDNGSTEPFFEKIGEHPDIRVQRFDENIGFGPACNVGAKMAKGDLLFFLNNDTQVKSDAITYLVEIMEADDNVGIAGPRLLNFDGHLQEAGALIHSDGIGQLIGFGHDPDTPRFTYQRRVDHISGAAIMVRAAIFNKLEGFDDRYAPAYCEDADLSLKVRAAGYDIVYQPKADIAHHLSRTTAKEGQFSLQKGHLVARNRAKLVAKWAPTLQKFDIRTIAFYLPQFHPVAENDLWWGKGFTEWRNSAKAKPNFQGHRQPRFPADLGYYDLRVAEVMEQQADLARRYGVTGFCYYYYWFGGQRILEMPLERLVKTGQPNLPFCLCWANENWTRRWDGKDQDILLKQEYGDADAVKFAEDIGRFFDLPNYITIDGKPLILIYRVADMPNPRRFLDTCRNIWRGQGHGEAVIAMVESFEFSAAPKEPTQFGANVTVEFPAHGMVHDPAMRVNKLNGAWTGSAHDYRHLATAFMNRIEPNFHRMRSVLVGWDTTPRHPDRSLVLEHATPGAFQAWLEWTYRRTKEQNFGDERLVFINAWNEWCEGSYLEPDLDYGHAYLQAVRNAQEAVMRGAHSFENI
ncbi:MAG: glycoside hydrolase family 99-like domain-containing protein, partial [Pseudomonadota bacterium]